MKKLLLTALLAAGCGSSSNSLSGSVSEIYALDYDSVAISLLDTFLIIEYNKGPDGSAGKAAKLSVDMTGLTVMPNVSIDLTQVVQGNPRGTLQQILGTSVDFPMMIGTLVLSGTPTAGQDLSGNFHATLSNPMGRTLNGNFSATVKQL
jgi:hypothetical protein